MVEYTGVWDHDETVAFLDGHAVPLRLACRTPVDRLWMLSLWFRYVPADDAGTDRTDGPGGEFHCATAADADVVDFLRADPDVAFEVSTNHPPYRGVRGRGTATVESEGATDTLRTLLERYLGGTDSDLARWLLSPEREEVRIRVAPDRLHSWDYTDRMGGATGTNAGGE